jgi:hypothetical protein
VKLVAGGTKHRGDDRCFRSELQVDRIRSQKNIDRFSRLAGPDNWIPRIREAGENETMKQKKDEESAWE